MRDGFFDLKVAAAASQKPGERLVVDWIATAIQTYADERHERNHDCRSFRLSPVNFGEPEYRRTNHENKNACDTINGDDAVDSIHQAQPRKGEASNDSSGDGKYAKNFRYGSCLHGGQRACGSKKDKLY